MMITVTFTDAKRIDKVQAIYGLWCDAARDRGCSSESMNRVYSDWQYGLVSLQFNDDELIEIVNEYTGD